MPDDEIYKLLALEEAVPHIMPLTRRDHELHRSMERIVPLFHQPGIHLDGNHLVHIAVNCEKRDVGFCQPIEAVNCSAADATVCTPTPARDAALDTLAARWPVWVAVSVIVVAVPSRVVAP